MGRMPEAARDEPLVVVAPDKLRGSISAARAADALARGAAGAGWRTARRPLSDGGEGFLEVLAGVGGALRTETVTGPLGEPVPAAWRLAGDLAVVESALASGLLLAGGAAGNDPLRATSRGTGELVAAALAAGARRILLGVGGSACTDGGSGALEALEEAGGLRGAEVLVACDVDVGFVDAAERFGPQKGADEGQVTALRRRLEALAGDDRRRYGVDVGTLAGAGAAGGLAGGLAALGARLVPGFDLVASMVGLEAPLAGADLVLSAEGQLDATSWRGKVVGALAAVAERHGVPLVVVAGRVETAGAEEAARRGVAVVDLVARYGEARAEGETARCLAEAAAAVVGARTGAAEGARRRLSPGGR
jgi:glycerate kinase